MGETEWMFTGYSEPCSATALEGHRHILKWAREKDDAHGKMIETELLFFKDSVVILHPN